MSTIRVFRFFFLLLSLSTSISIGHEECSLAVKRLQLEPKDFSCLKSCYVKLSDDFFSLSEDCKQACRNYCNSRVNLHLFFVNGILTEEKDAQGILTKTLSEFKSGMHQSQPKILNQLNILPNVAYNQSHGFIVDLATAAFQRFTALEAQMFFLFLEHLEKAPSWFQVLVGEKMRQLSQIDHMANVIFKKSSEQMLRNFYTALSGPHPDAVLIVTHSQGNLFLYHLTPLLLNELSKDKENYYFHTFLKDKEILNLTAVQTALPVRQAIGINHAPARGSLPNYFTLKSDGYMRLLEPFAPPPTIDNETGGLFEHYFLEHYLGGKNSGPAIRKAMVLETCWVYLTLFDPYDHNDWWDMAKTSEDGYCIF